MIEVRQLLAQARSELNSLDQGSLDAEVLLCDLLGVTRAWLYANPDTPVESDLSDQYLAFVQKRLSGEPVAYLTGEREFWSMQLTVTPDVLIPRPETELLVEYALSHIPMNANWRIADLGTGSGAIALAIAKERPRCRVHATDISSAALSVAQSNANRLNISNITFHCGSWLEPLPGKFDVIVSNPPYVSSADPHLHQGDCRFEPSTALTPGKDGLASIRIIADTARDVLNHDGILAFEHGFDQGTSSQGVLESLGYQNVSTKKDLAGLDRITVGTLSL